MSAPHSPGGASSASASRSVAAVTSAPASCAALQSARKSRTAPSVAGYWTTHPTTRCPSPVPAKRNSEGSCTRTVTPLASARVCTTAIVCGWHCASTRKTGRSPCFTTAMVSAIASAAAVASSSSDALAIDSAVRSLTIVWKLSSASSRPWAISGWYGV